MNAPSITMNADVYDKTCRREPTVRRGNGMQRNMNEGKEVHGRVQKRTKHRRVTRLPSATSFLALALERKRKRLDGLHRRRLHEFVHFGFEFGAELVADASVGGGMKTVGAGGQRRLRRHQLLNLEPQILSGEEETQVNVCNWTTTGFRMRWHLRCELRMTLRSRVRKRANIKIKRMVDSSKLDVRSMQRNNPFSSLIISWNIIFPIFVSYFQRTSVKNSYIDFPSTCTWNIATYLKAM